MKQIKLCISWNDHEKTWVQDISSTWTNMTQGMKISKKTEKIGGILYSFQTPVLNSEANIQGVWIVPWNI